jgi:hypothetical protein
MALGAAGSSSAPVIEDARPVIKWRRFRSGCKTVGFLEFLIIIQSSVFEQQSIDIGINIVLKKGNSSVTH